MTNFLKQFFDIKFWKFIMVGILNTIVGVGLKFLMLNLIAGVTSTGLSSIMSYFLNKHFTFKNKEKGIKPAIRFAVNIACCYGIAYVTMVIPTIYICDTFQLSMFGMTVADFGKNLSAFLESCMFVVCNYVGQRFFAFKEKTEEQQKNTEGACNEAPSFDVWGISVGVGRNTVVQSVGETLRIVFVIQKKLTLFVEG